MAMTKALKPNSRPLSQLLGFLERGDGSDVIAETVAGHAKRVPVVGGLGLSLTAS